MAAFLEELRRNCVWKSVPQLTCGSKPPITKQYTAAQTGKEKGKKRGWTESKLLFTEQPPPAECGLASTNLGEPKGRMTRMLGWKSTCRWHLGRKWERKKSRKGKKNTQAPCRRMSVSPQPQTRKLKLMKYMWGCYDWRNAQETTDLSKLLRTQQRNLLERLIEVAGATINPSSKLVGNTLIIH